jgi:hypothetical protein
MKKIIFFVLGILFQTTLFAQSQETINLNKYWRYRERLKNFVVQGDCQGCCLIKNKD